MDLTRIERLRVHAADGLATDDERAELAAAGVEPDAWDALPGLVRAALVPAPHPDLASGALADAVLREVGHASAVAQHASVRAALEALAAPDLADSVLAALDLDEPWRAGLRGALDPGPAPDVAASVMRALGQADSGAAGVGHALRESAGDAPELGDAVLGSVGAADDLGALLRAALDAGEAPDVADSVLARIGAAAAAPVGEALSDGAGPAPELWGDIAEAIGAEVAPTVAPSAAPPAPVISLERERTARRPWLAGVAGLAAAAAALFIALGPWGGDTAAPYNYELAAVNTVEIEDISVGDDAIVQVLQFEDDAPTIIFIDVLAEPLSDDADEGATL